MRISTLFDGAILLLLLALLVVSVDFGFKQGLFPWIFILGTMGATVIKMAREAWTRRDEEQVKRVDDLRLGEWLGGLREGQRGYLLAVAWIVGFLFMLYSLGFIVTIPVFTILYLKLHEESWLVSGIVAASLIAVIYGVLVIGLNFPLYEGVIFRYIP